MSLGQVLDCLPLMVWVTGMVGSTLLRHHRIKDELFDSATNAFEKPPIRTSHHSYEAKRNTGFYLMQD
jgi:hypothetical protein